MPRRLTETKKGTHQMMKNISFEKLIVSRLMQDGWQVFLPVLDNGHKTDILISDGPNYYRIQVKTIDASSEEHIVENSWKDSMVDVVIFFARNSTWGYICPGFDENKKALNAKGHRRFLSTDRKGFIKEFHLLEI